MSKIQTLTTDGTTRRSVLSNVGKTGVVFGASSIFAGQSAIAESGSTDQLTVYVPHSHKMDFSTTSVRVVDSLSSADFLLMRADRRLERDLIVEALTMQTAVAVVGSRAQHELLARMYDAAPERIQATAREGASLPSDLDFSLGAAVPVTQQSRFVVLVPRGRRINTHTYSNSEITGQTIAATIQDTVDQYSGANLRGSTDPGGCGEFGHFDDPWNCLGTVHQSLGNCPHGEVDVYTTAAYVDDSGNRYFGIEQEFDIRPGVGEFSPCSSGWKNDKLEIANGYNDVDNGNGFLVDVEPNTTTGQTSSSTSITVGISADTENVVSGTVEAGWSTSYSQPGIVIEENEYNNQGIGGNDVVFAGNNVKNTTADFNRSDLLEFPQSTNALSLSSDVRMTFFKPGTWWNPTDNDEWKTYSDVEILSFS